MIPTGSWPWGSDIQVVTLCTVGQLAREYDRSIGEQPATAAQRNLAVAYSRLGDVYLEAGRRDEAERAYQSGFHISNNSLLGLHSPPRQLIPFSACSHLTYSMIWPASSRVTPSTGFISPKVQWCCGEP